MRNKFETEVRNPKRPLKINNVRNYSNKERVKSWKI